MYYMLPLAVVFSVILVVAMPTILWILAIVWITKLHSWVGCLFIPFLFFLFYRFSSEVQRMLVKLLSTLAQLQVCHTAIPNHLCAPREGSLRKLEERGTAGASGFNFVLVRVRQFVLIVCSNVFATLGIQGSFSWYFNFGYLFIHLDCLMLSNHACSYSMSFRGSQFSQQYLTKPVEHMILFL